MPHYPNRCEAKKPQRLRSGNGEQTPAGSLSSVWKTIYATLGAIGTRLWTFVNTKLALNHTTTSNRLGHCLDSPIAGEETSEALMQDCSGSNSSGQWSKFLVHVMSAVLLAIVSAAQTLPARAELVDELDSYPPRWRMAENDCNAQVLKHENLSRGGHDGGPCETITVRMGQGSSCWLAYPIEPVRPLDDLVATTWVSATGSVRVGFRLRYPYVADPQTKRPVNVMVPGTTLRQTDRWTRIGIGQIEKSVQAATMSVRNQHGRDADVRDVMVDAILLDIYSGTATHRLQLDQLKVSGMVSVTASESPDKLQTSARPSTDSDADSNNDSEIDNRRLINDQRLRPFPTGKVTRILQYNGEPLPWVRSLGFDAIWLSSPVDSAVLGEAIQNGILIYAPPPSVVSAELEPLLEPVAGWIIDGASTVDSDENGLNEQTLPSVAKRITRIRGLPRRWQRPIVAAPQESFQKYASRLDGFIYDLPPRVRGVSAAEETIESTYIASLASTRVQYAIGVDTMPPSALMAQAERTADSIGATPPSMPQWQSLWTQVFRHLPETPSAVLYRSSRSLTSDPVYDANRATALSYINRMMAMIEPWVASSTGSRSPVMLSVPTLPGQRIQTTGNLAYHQAGFSNEGSQWWIVTSDAGVGSLTLAGDGGEMVIPLPPDQATTQVWRLTHFSAERLPVETTSLGPVVRIVSPDAVEIVVITGDASVGGQLSNSASRFARQAIADRWMMAQQSLNQTQNAWEVAAATGSVSTSPPALLTAAAQTLNDASPLFQADDHVSAIHAARRSDAWTQRSRLQLRELLVANEPRYFSSPLLDVGGFETHGMMTSVMSSKEQSRTEDWGRNLITTGSLDDVRALGPGRWSFGNRLESMVQSRISHMNQRTYAGTGALRATASLKTVVMRGGTPSRIGGGYGGTVMQIRSPSVRVERDTDIRFDAMIRTIGFSGPHQGVLMYESIGGQASGILIRGAADWTPVRLLRRSLDDGEVSVYFEMLGDGEAMIDEVSMRIRQVPKMPPPLRPMISRSDSETSEDDAESIER
jgi:hypothetical protein